MREADKTTAGVVLHPISLPLALALHETTPTTEEKGERRERCSTHKLAVSWVGEEQLSSAQGSSVPLSPLLEEGDELQLILA